MTAKTFSDMNFQLKLLVIITASLAVLLLLLRTLELLLKKISQIRAEDQLGRSALVIAAIKPTQLGRIRYVAANGKNRQAPARSDTVIPAGSTVVIISFQADIFIVQPAVDHELEPVSLGWS